MDVYTVFNNNFQWINMSFYECEDNAVIILKLVLPENIIMLKFNQVTLLNPFPNKKF